jgi:hypothetical protein
MFPDWINRVLEHLPPMVPTTDQPPQWSQGTVDYTSGARMERRWGAAQVASITSKMICHECNTGWMADLEGRSAPLLTPMILGQPHSLTQADQLTAALWTAKTVMVMEPTLGRQDNFPPDQRQAVMRGYVPGHFRVFAAAIEDQIPPLRFSCVRSEVERAGLPFVKLHFYTLQINTLVVQLLRGDPPPPRYGALEEVAHPFDAEVSLWPPVPEFFWPPKLSLDNEGLSRYVGRLGPLHTPPWHGEPPDRPA